MRSAISLHFFLSDMESHHTRLPGFAARILMRFARSSTSQISPRSSFPSIDLSASANDVISLCFAEPYCEMAENRFHSSICSRTPQSKQS